MTSLERDLLAIEERLWTGGPEAYRRHVDSRCLVVFAEKAGVMSRTAIARSAKKGRWRDVSFEPRGFIRPSDDTAVLTYECHATRSDGGPYHAFVSSGYVEREAGWKLAFHQQTAIPSGAAE